MKFTKYILGLLTFAGALTFGSCTDENLKESNVETVDPDDDGMVDVTIRFNLRDEVPVGTRADGEDAAATNMEEDIDLLIYALRDAKGNVLLQYGQGLIDDDEKTLFKSKAIDEGRNYTIDDDNNQTLRKVSWKKRSIDEKAAIYEMEDAITLRVMRNTVFKLSCWTQSSKTDAYDFNDFTCVKVRYEDAKNNEEQKLRDAFCATSTFSIGQVASDISVTLTRPLARINVGVNNTDINKNPGYKASSIKLGGVAKYFNVVDNEVWSQESIDAYMAANEDKFYGEEANGNVTATTDVEFSMSPFIDGIFPVYDYSNFNGSATKKDYKTISMCYVLVPESEFNTDGNGNYEENGEIYDEDGIYVNGKETRIILYDYAGGAVIFKRVEATNDSGETYWRWNRDTEKSNYIFDKNGKWVSIEKPEYLARDAAIDTKDSGRIIYQKIKNYKKEIPSENEDEEAEPIYEYYYIELQYDFDNQGWFITALKENDENGVDKMAEAEEIFKDQEEFLSYIAGDSSTGVIYPGQPDDQAVYLNLLSLSLSTDGTNADLVHSPKEANKITPLKIRVKRNWRSNLLFEKWENITNNGSNP